VCALVATSATLPSVYWAIGVPLGLALIAGYEVRRERRIGAESRLADPALGAFLAIAAGVLAVNGLTDSDVAWAFPVALGWLALAAIDRDALMGAAGVALMAIAVVVIAVDPVDAWAWTQLAMAGLLIAAGIAARSSEPA
jgi:hypothetical protein